MDNISFTISAFTNKHDRRRTLEAISDASPEMDANIVRRQNRRFISYPT